MSTVSKLGLLSPAPHTVVGKEASGTAAAVHIVICCNCKHLGALGCRLKRLLLWSLKSINFFCLINLLGVYMEACSIDSLPKQVQLVFLEFALSHVCR